MEELFRFLQTRPAQRVAIEKVTVLATPSTELHELLTSPPTKSSTELKQICLSYLNSGRSLLSVSDLEYGVGLTRLLEELKDIDQRQPEQLSADIKKHFGMSVLDLVNQNGFRTDRKQLSDVLILNSILSQDGKVSSREATDLLRLIDLIEHHAANDHTLTTETGISLALKKIIALPEDIFPLFRSADTFRTTNPVTNSATDGRLQVLRADRDRLLATYRMITSIKTNQIVSDEQRDSMDEDGTKVNLFPINPLNKINPDNTSNSKLATSLVNRKKGGLNIMLHPSVFEATAEPERTVLAKRGIDPTKTDLTTIADRLSVELEEIERNLALLEEKHDPIQLMFSKIVPSSTVERFGDELSVTTRSIPSTHGRVKPVGIGDLLVVRQFLKAYEARELAHVENILKGEYKQRMHRRSHTTEETLATQTEFKHEEERDQQTTERFELKTESSQVQKEDESLKIGVSVSGKYGPTVEFKAYTDYALSSSKEEAVKIATNYSKDITTRASSKIFERRSEERILKTIEVFEETNTHGINNKEGSEHVIGQYQWIDKIYEAQVYNYGIRMLFDIMLPEPAAFLLHALSKGKTAAIDFEKPKPFSINPSEITEWNYGSYVKEYEVIGVTSPPQPYIYVSKSVEGKGKETEGATKILEIPLGDGYEAIAYQWYSFDNEWEGGDLKAVLLPEPKDNVSGTISLAILTHRIEAFTFSVSILCQCTQRALNEWKLKTHAAILQAYQKKLRDYEEKITALEIQAAQQIQGRNPVENELLIRNEIKKGSISVLSGQQYDLFGSIGTSIQGYPQPILAEAEIEGKYIRFFEQAFEWEQMMYFLYPYFWGKKSNWLNKISMQDVDTRFAEFIRAGSGRVVVSVRPGFEMVIAHFLNTGEIWEGGDPPEASSPLYVSIIDEIRERDKAPGSEMPQGDPWDVRLPTTLLLLRDNAKLPTWKKMNVENGFQHRNQLR
jgi:hypothetical protein